MNPLAILRRHGVAGTVRKAWRRAQWRATWTYHVLRHWRAPQYRNPTEAELATIENEFKSLGVPVGDYYVDISAFADFEGWSNFPSSYYRGQAVRREKLLEHHIAAELTGVTRFRPGDTYVDVAALDSPWALRLSERGIDALAIDLIASHSYGHLPGYRVMDATNTSFTDRSIAAISLQCAYEMFGGHSDVALLAEAGRILRPGGRLVILPLYLHTHDCAYATPEHYGRGNHDPGSREYLRRDAWGVPSSRKYSAGTLKRRILDEAERLGLRSTLLVLRNKASVGEDIYCHFILVLEVPA